MSRPWYMWREWKHRIASYLDIIHSENRRKWYDILPFVCFDWIWMTNIEVNGMLYTVIRRQLHIDTVQFFDFVSLIVKFTWTYWTKIKFSFSFFGPLKITRKDRRVYTNQ